MPMIPPPIMSALKIQVNHIIMDSSRKTSWTIAALPNKLTEAPLTLKKDAIEKVNGDDGINKKMGDAMVNATNAQKLKLVQEGNVAFANMVDKINTTAFSAGGVNGFQSLVFETEQSPKIEQFWFSAQDRDNFKTVENCKVFRKKGVRKFNGSVEDDEQVNRYVSDIVDNKATWSILLVEYTKAIERLIKKILIFINTTIQQTKLAVRAVLTLLKIMEESFEYTSSVFQTVVTVGGPVSQVSVITT